MFYLYVLVFGLLTSCMTYVEKPLPSTTQFAEVPQGKTLKVSDLIEIAIKSNMDLRLQKKELAIAEAEVYSAGLFDDINFSLDFERDTTPSPSILGTDWSFGYDLQTLITRSASIDAAEFERQKKLYSIIWAEWQLAWHVRLLYAKHVYLTHQSEFINEQAKHLNHFYRSLAKSLSRKTKKVSDVSGALVSYKAAQKYSNHFNLRIQQNLQELKKVLGVAPDTVLKIDTQMLPPPPTIAEEEIEEALKNIIGRRPDLLALKAGYESQDKKLRIELLKQFPSLNVYISRSKGTAEGHSTGFGLSFNLPLFNVNRGNIMIESAHRDQMHMAFQSKLNEVTTNIRNAQENVALLKEQIAKLQTQTKHLNGSLSLAKRAHENKIITKESLHEIRNGALSARQELVEAQHSLYETMSGLLLELGFSVIQKGSKGE